MTAAQQPAQLGLVKPKKEIKRRGVSAEVYAYMRAHPGESFTCDAVSQELYGLRDRENGGVVSSGLNLMARPFVTKAGIVTRPGIERVAHNRYRFSTALRDAQVAAQGGLDPWAREHEGTPAPAATLAATAPQVEGPPEPGEQAIVGLLLEVIAPDIARGTDGSMYRITRLG